MAILFAVVLIDLIGFGIVIPILPFLSPELGATKIDIALILASYAVMSGVFGSAWGRLSDRIGRKPVIMICLAGGAVSYVMLGLATQLWMVYASRAFAGLMAGNLGVATAMMGDITSPENRARSMGLIGGAFGLGMIIGPALGGLLSHGDFTLPCIVAGGISTLAIVAAALFLPESLSEERKLSNRQDQRSGDKVSVLQMLRETGNTLLVMQYSLHNACVSFIAYLYPLWVGDVLGWGAREVGIVYGIQGVLMVIIQIGALGMIVRVLGEARALRIGISFFLLGICIAVFAEGMYAMVGSMYIAMSGATICMPVLNSITTHRTPARLRGRMMGTTSASSSWGRVLGPVLAGGVLALFGYSAAWMVCALLICSYLTWAFRSAVLADAQPAG